LRAQAPKKTAELHLQEQMRTIRIFEDETAFQRDTVERIVATLEAALGERGIATK
jgi:hypothetical protein